MLTRTFKHADSLAVILPAELSPWPENQELEIERQGTSLVLRPVRRASFSDLAQVLAAFPPGFMSEGRDLQASPETDDDGRPNPLVDGVAL